MSLIVGLLILGLALIALEIFIPGGIVGVFGGLCLLASIGVAYNEYKVEGALIVFGISLLGLVISLYCEFKILPKTEMGKRFFLQNKIESQSQPSVGDNSMIGKVGKAATTLSPSGYIVVEGKKLEAYSRSGFLDKGESVKIDSYDQFKITVSKI